MPTLGLPAKLRFDSVLTRKSFSCLFIEKILKP